MFWAVEISDKYPGYLWKRLSIIVNEDIGLADPQVIILIDTLKRQYDLAAHGSYSPQERIILATAILAMCRAKKSRLSDNFACVVSQRREFEGLKPEIPDYAFDHHTKKGQKMGRGWDHWRDEGCLLVSEDEGLDIYRDEAHRLRKKNGRLPKREKPVGKKDLNSSGDLFADAADDAREDLH